VNRLPMKLTSPATVDAGAPVKVALPDGPGFYVLRRFAQVHTAGAAAANHQPSLMDSNSNAALEVAWAASAASPVASPVRWPADNASPTEAGRHFYSDDGNLWWAPGGDVAGDTYQASFYVERIR
jgi:hypothetical protein